MRSRLTSAAALSVSALSLVLMSASHAHARYDERDAQRACELAVERNYGYRELRDTQVSDNRGQLAWGKDGDTWYIGIDEREFFVVPEAAVVGG